MERPSRRLGMGGAVVELWPTRTVTRLVSGGVVEAAPEDTDGYRATAERLGYGADTARMSRDHEILHTALAHFLGLPESPTLRRVADWGPSDALTNLEEDAVLAIQAFVNAAGVDLLRVLSRRFATSV